MRKQMIPESVSEVAQILAVGVLRLKRRQAEQSQHAFQRGGEPVLPGRDISHAGGSRAKGGTR